MRLAVLIALAVVASGCIGVSDVRTGKVINVVDGDTIDVRFQDNTVDRIRLLGVDTPETYSNNTPEEFNATDADCVRGYGERASSFVKQQLLNKSVKVRTDVDKRGDYGRLLAYVHKENTSTTSINQKLVQKGFARVYISVFEEKDKFLFLQQEALEDKRGVWSCN